MLPKTSPKSFFWHLFCLVVTLFSLDSCFILEELTKISEFRKTNFLWRSVNFEKGIFFVEKGISKNEFGLLKKEFRKRNSVCWKRNFEKGILFERKRNLEKEILFERERNFKKEIFFDDQWISKKEFSLTISDFRKKNDSLTISEFRKKKFSLTTSEFRESNLLCWPVSFHKWIYSVDKRLSQIALSLFLKASFQKEFPVFDKQNQQ